MKNVRWIFLIVTITTCFFVSLKAENVWGQADLEDWLDGIIIPDYYPDGEPAYVPYRYRDSLPEFQEFFVKSGWTTNQLIEGLILVVTNNLVEGNWTDPEKQRMAGMAIWKLTEINHPSVTNFFYHFNETDRTQRFKRETIPAMIHFTNVEPNVLSYLRSKCTDTNIYDHVALSVADALLEALHTMPSEFKLESTNRIARYMYYSLHYMTKSMLWQDRELAKLIPLYSNSVQRLELMNYVIENTTNAVLRNRVQIEAERLSAIPTNQLNDVSWITE